MLCFLMSPQIFIPRKRFPAAEAVKSFQLQVNVADMALQMKLGSLGFPIECEIAVGARKFVKRCSKPILGGGCIRVSLKLSHFKINKFQLHIKRTVNFSPNFTGLIYVHPEFRCEVRALIEKQACCSIFLSKFSGSNFRFIRQIQKFWHTMNQHVLMTKFSRELLSSVNSEIPKIFNYK